MILDLLRTPSSFSGEPLKAVRNQGGHAGIGMLIAWAFGPLALVPIALAYALWEGVQWRVYGGEDWDCVEDWCFVMTGAVAAVIQPMVPLGVTVMQFVVLAAWLVRVYLRRVDAAGD